VIIIINTCNYFIGFYIIKRYLLEYSVFVPIFELLYIVRTYSLL